MGGVRLADKNGRRGGLYLSAMAGRRPLTRIEERALLKVVRKLSPRDRALVTTQWLTGFRISEVLSLTVGQVSRAGEILPKIGIAPRNLKGGYGTTRWVPVLPELRRALEKHLWWLGLKFQLEPKLPLFPSRKPTSTGEVRPIARARAHALLKSVFARAGVADDGRLGTHSLRKTFARSVYVASGRDLMVLKRALGHSDVAVTQKYLEVDEDRVASAIARCDFTRKPRKVASPPPPVAVIPKVMSVAMPGEEKVEQRVLAPAQLGFDFGDAA
jgi:integrase